jgi:electron transfer flavoprotein alpha subunit
MELFAYIVHNEGTLDDIAAELYQAAQRIDVGTAVTAVVTGTGASLESACQAAAKLYPKVWKVDHAELAYPNAEAVRPALTRILPSGALVLVPHDHFGLDLSPGLSVKLDATFVPDVVSIEGLEAGTLKVVRQEFGGMVSTHVSVDVSDGAVINIRPGAFQAENLASAGGEVVDKSGEAGDIRPRRKFLEVVEAETGDVDITKSEVLVSVGRGIEEEENIAVVQELAEAMGADLACSRPIVDAKWLEKSRQVGTSGVTVKPKVYIACGISGSFQHLGGIKGAPFIVAINKNPKAPIFQVADVGIEADILEFLPVLTEKLVDIKG